MTYKFDAAAIQNLLGQEPDYFLIKTSIEPRVIDTENVGVVVIIAEAYKNGELLLGQTVGCPVPPCTKP